MAAAIARCGAAWAKFRQHLPLLTARSLPLKLKGRFFSSNVRSSLLYATETWPMPSAALHRLMRNNCAMIRWMCRAIISNGPPIEDLLEKLGIHDLVDLIRERRLEPSSSEINRVRTMPIPGKRGPGRPAMTWDELVNKDLKDRGLKASDAQNRTQWRASVRKVSARDSHSIKTKPDLID